MVGGGGPSEVLPLKQRGVGQDKFESCWRGVGGGGHKT